MTWGRESHRPVPSDWKKRKALVLERDRGVCHACGHGGADDVDHLVNVAAGGTHELDNLGTIHSGRCPTCRKHCHKAKTAAEAAAGRRARHKQHAERHPGLTGRNPCDHFLTGDDI